MTLTDEQKSSVVQWIESGLGLSDVQKKLREDFDISATYMETRFLVDDLKLTLHDEPEDEPEALETAPDAVTPPGGAIAPDEVLPPGGGGVQVTIDQIARPNAMISGKVVFSDGERAEWSLDQMGRLGLQPETTGYRPGEADVMKFQVELQRLAASQGL